MVERNTATTKRQNNAEEPNNQTTTARRAFRLQSVPEPLDGGGFDQRIGSIFGPLDGGSCGEAVVIIHRQLNRLPLPTTTLGPRAPFSLPLNLAVKCEFGQRRRFSMVMAVRRFRRFVTGYAAIVFLRRIVVNNIGVYVVE